MEDTGINWSNPLKWIYDKKNDHILFWFLSDPKSYLNNASNYVDISNRIILNWCICIYWKAILHQIFSF